MESSRSTTRQQQSPPRLGSPIVELSAPMDDPPSVGGPSDYPSQAQSNLLSKRRISNLAPVETHYKRPRLYVDATGNRPRTPFPFPPVRTVDQPPHACGDVNAASATSGSEVEGSSSGSAYSQTGAAASGSLTLFQCAREQLQGFTNNAVRHASSNQMVKSMLEEEASTLGTTMSLLEAALITSEEQVRGNVSMEVRNHVINQLISTLQSWLQS